MYRIPILEASVAGTAAWGVKKVRDNPPARPQFL